MNKLICLLLAPLALFGQDTAVKFATTTNASRFGVGFVVGFEFTVNAPITVTALGAVLADAPLKPVFGALPRSMQVGLWNNKRQLLASANVSETNTLTGHFNYAPVKATELKPGARYTIGGVVAAGQSSLSDVPDLTTGHDITYVGPKTLISNSLAFPAKDVLGQRKNYFGPSFSYTVGTQQEAAASDAASGTSAP
jgi:hypothetical protein